MYEEYNLNIIAGWWVFVLFISAKITAIVVNAKEIFEIMKISNINVVKHVRRNT